MPSVGVSEQNCDSRHRRYHLVADIDRDAYRHAIEEVHDIVGHHPHASVTRTSADAAVFAGGDPVHEDPR